MSVSLDLIFYVIALVLFALAFFGIAARFNLVAGGLFFWLLAAAF